MSESKNWQPNILFHSEFIKDIENKGNISAFYTLYLTRSGLGDDYSMSITEENSENVINDDIDIEDLINNSLFNDYKNNRTTIEQVYAEFLNENLIVIDITKRKDPTFLYENHYWCVFLYKKDEKKEDAYNGSELKRNYLRLELSNGESILYKIGFIMNIPNNRNIHREVDNIFYLNLDPFTVNTRFEGIDTPDNQKTDNKIPVNIHNNEFKEKNEGVLYNHFHKSSNDGSLYPYETKFVVNQARDIGFNVDYFDTPTSEDLYHNNNGLGCVLSIFGEDIGIRNEVPMSMEYTYFPRKYAENNTHLQLSSNNTLYYNIKDSVPFSEEILFPSETFNDFQIEDQIEIYVDLKRNKGLNLEVELKIQPIQGESFKVFWNFNKDNNSYQKFYNLEENKIKHIYEEDDSYAIIRIEGKVKALDISDKSLEKCNIRSLALYSDSIIDLGLSNDNINTSLYKLFLYKCSPTLSSEKLKLRFFKSLIHFEDSYEDKYAFDGCEYNPFFADQYAPTIPNYNKIIFNDIKNASNLFSGWKKDGKIEFISNDEVYSFDSLINNSFITSITVNLTKNNNITTDKVSSFKNGFENDKYLSSVILNGFNNIKFNSIDNLFSGCENLITIRSESDFENCIPFKSSKTTSMNKAFFNTKSLESLNFKDFDVESMIDAFNGSGIIEVDYSNENSCKDFSGAFANCDNLNVLRLNLMNANSISRLIENSKNLKVIELKNVRIPIDFNRIYNENNNGIKYSISISPLLNVINDGINIDFDKDYFSSIKSPQIKIGEGLTSEIIREIIKSDNLLSFEDKVQYSVLDISQCSKEQKDFIREEVSRIKGWFLYDNYNINNFVYIDFITQGLKSSYNWNSLELDKDYKSSFIKGGSEDSYIISNNGERTNIEVEVIDAPKYNKNSYAYTDVLDTSSSLFKTVIKFGAVDMLFGSAFSDEDTPCYIKIRNNKVGLFSVVFICNFHNRKKTDEKSKIALMLENDSINISDPISNKIQFTRINDSNYDKINIFKDESWSKQNFDSFYELDNSGPELVIFNLTSTAIESEAVFRLSGKYALNGFIIADSLDVIDIIQ